MSRRSLTDRTCVVSHSVESEPAPWPESEPQPEPETQHEPASAWPAAFDRLLRDSPAEPDSTERRGTAGADEHPTVAPTSRIEPVRVL